MPSPRPFRGPRFTTASTLLILCVGLLLFTACGTLGDSSEAATTDQKWALCIHGGAGVVELSAEQERAYRESLRSALDLG